jgi:hypothetical protein
MKPEPKPDQSVAIQQNSDDVNLRISYDVNSARNTWVRDHLREVLGVSGVLDPPCVFFTMIVGWNSGTGIRCN